MIIFDRIHQEFRSISDKVTLSTYVKEGTDSFLNSASSCNSGYLIKTEIRQFSGVSCRCSERNTLLVPPSVFLVVSVLPEKCSFALGDWGVRINYSTALLNSRVLGHQLNFFSHDEQLPLTKHGKAYSVWLWTKVRNGVSISLEEQWSYNPLKIAQVLVFHSRNKIIHG